MDAVLSYIMNPKIFIKNIIAGLLYHSCLLDMLSTKRLSGRGFILMYHRVVRSREQDRNMIQPGMFVTQETFGKHLAFLKKEFSIITLDEMVLRIARGQSVSRCCAITFDDGWKDTYDVAFPILKKYQVPVSVFLASGYIGTEKWFWPEDLAWCLENLLKRDAWDAETDGLINSLMPVVNSSNKKNRTDLIDDAIVRVKKYRPEKRNALLAAMREALPGRSRERLMMSWDEAAEMHKSGLVSFGAHTVNHIYLDQMGQDTARLEISSSKKVIEDHLGVPVTLFAYPNGNYTPQMIGMLEQSGFLGAVTTKRGYVDKNTPLMEMPRIAMHDDVSKTIPLFFSRLLFSFF